MSDSKHGHKHSKKKRYNEHGKKIHHHKHEDFKTVHKDCAHGLHGIISVVKRGSDGKLIIWKRPRTRSYTHQESFQQEIKKSKSWRKFGVSQVKVCWHPDKQSLLKTYVKGKTLKQTLEHDPKFFSKKKSKSLEALGRLVRLLIDSKHYIQDVNRQNLIFDGNNWHIIDSSVIHGKTTRSDTRQRYKKAFLKSWSKSLSSDSEIDDLKSFIGKYCC